MIVVCPSKLSLGIAFCVRKRYIGLMADSIFTAAKKLAESCGLPWTDVGPLYRALQEPDDRGGTWLPVSRGRAIHRAQPYHLARLLIALGFGGDPTQARRNLRLAQGMRELVGERYNSLDHSAPLSAVEEALAELLTKPHEADRVVRIEFQPDCRRIIFELKAPHEFRHFGDPDFDGASPGIATRHVIFAGPVRLLSREVEWGEG
ncbi:hypothetical protein [Endobacter medicaginis]